MEPKKIKVTSYYWRCSNPTHRHLEKKTAQKCLDVELRKDFIEAEKKGFEALANKILLDYVLDEGMSVLQACKETGARYDRVLSYIKRILWDITDKMRMDIFERANRLYNAAHHWKELDDGDYEDLMEVNSYDRTGSIYKNREVLAPLIKEYVKKREEK